MSWRLLQRHVVDVRIYIICVYIFKYFYTMYGVLVAISTTFSRSLGAVFPKSSQFAGKIRDAIGIAKTKSTMEGVPSSVSFFQFLRDNKKPLL